LVPGRTHSYKDGQLLIPFFPSSKRAPYTIPSSDTTTTTTHIQTSGNLCYESDGRRRHLSLLLLSRPSRVCSLRALAPHRSLTGVTHSRTYCSNECERLDGSGSVSSASSSAFSSPVLDPAYAAQDVPSLVPSALGRALRSYNRRTTHSATVSSASEDEDDHRVYLNTTSHKTPSMRPTGMPYARRPAGTNHRSTIPLLLGPTAPTRFKHGTSDPEEDSLDIGAPLHRSAGRAKKLSPSPPRLANAALANSTATVTMADVRKKHRASLPAQFKLLAVSPPHTAYSGSPSRTLASSSYASRPPSPTPQPVREISTAAPAARPRGRCREAGEPCVAAGRIRSRSGQRRARAISVEPAMVGYEPDVESSEVELELDFDPALDAAPQPIPTHRPLQPLQMPERGRWCAAARDSYAPGYGAGRSGLRRREFSRPKSPERRVVVPAV
jgi:hypothetical protein